MHVLVAPDKFAGTLDAPAAARAIADGWARARPDDEVVLLPLADGGPGTVDALAAAGTGDLQRTSASDPLGRPLTATWWRSADAVAVVEVASTCGLHLVGESERDPLRATSAGLGAVLRAVADARVREVVVGLGGTATVDAGVGALRALGVPVTDADGRAIADGDVAALRGLAHLGPVPVTLSRVRAASDVTNPLLGPSGAARVFGPQKGADPAAVEVLESALTRVADVAERDLPGGPWRDLPGAGAAGGLGFALRAWFDAAVVGGADLVGSAVGLEAAIATADVVVTGEGGLDRQTAGGKVPEHVRRVARAAGRPVLVVAGRIEAGAADGYDDHAELGPVGLERPAERCAEVAAVLAGRR